MRINRHDTNGAKPLLSKGELGYDDYTAGGDTGRVYVGTGAENIALAERLEANMMTKAQFNAIAEERKANRAGSGFDEWGKHYSNTATNPNVNEGIWTGNSYINKFMLGTITSPIGASKTKEPFSTVNGVIQKIYGTNYENADRINSILLPTAPNIYPYGTVLTAEQIASGVIKHADASNSGLIVNGKFDTDTSGWTSNYPSSTIEALSGKLKITNVGGSYAGARTSISTVVGKTYILEAKTGVLSGTNIIYGIGISAGADSIKAGGMGSQNTRYTVEFTAISTTTHLLFRTGNNTAGNYIELDDIAVYPADAISRSDLVFLESWHEDVSEKNFVYPLGNVQYLGANTDGLTGIVNGAFTGFETYSLFGNWQTSSALIGKGYVWSSLTETQKKAFISNSDNNCYLDGDKVIQVRYRVRVVQGWGDSWGGVYNDGITANINYNVSNLLLGKGKQVYYTDISATNTYALRNEVAVYGIGAWGNTSTTLSYDGKCFALPIALVHRRNQGVYHPVYNPNGTKKTVYPGNSDASWYQTNLYASFAQTMTDYYESNSTVGYKVNSGYIGTTSGRPDGLFYDQVHESDITDLRNSSKKVEDYNRLISREFNKLVAGTNRGKEGENFIDIKKITPTKVAYSSVHTSYYVVLPNTSSSDKYLMFYNNKIYRLTYITYDTGNGFACVSSDIDSLPNVPIAEYIFFKVSSFEQPNGELPRTVNTKSTRIKSNTLLHCDIIGNPTNYPTAWEQSGVFGTPLIVAEDGTSLLPTGSLTAFKLSRKANATPLLVLKSTDSGATWTALTVTTHYTFSTTTNAITMVTAPATTDLIMIFYQTHTSMAVPTVNSEVLEIGDLYSHNYYGETNYLQQTLINKINTNNTFTGTCLFTGKLLSYAIYNSKLRAAVSDTPVNHQTIAMIQGAQPLVKLFPYLTRLNGKAYLNLVFKEMKHNGTSWGDSNNFEIVDNVSTTIDNNAQTVLIGQKTVELNVFIGADE